MESLSVVRRIAFQASKKLGLEYGDVYKELKGKTAPEIMAWVQEKMRAKEVLMRYSRHMAWTLYKPLAGSGWPSSSSRTGS
jgi:hypothetical protein